MNNMDIPENMYLGSLCKNNHDWESTGKSLRYKINRACKQCSSKLSVINSRKRLAKMSPEAILKLKEQKNAYDKVYRQKNAEKKQAHDKIYGKLYYVRNKDKMLEYQKIWRENNPDKYKSQQEKGDRVKVDKLTDGYIKNILRNRVKKTNIKANIEITQDLIDAERQYILLRRLKQQIKEKQDE